MVAAIPPGRFPNVAWVGADLVAGSADDRFEFGLSLLLDGLGAFRG